MRRWLYSVCLLLMAGFSTYAFPVELNFSADSLQKADSLTDEEILKMLESPHKDTVVRQKSKGVDVSKLVNAKRMRPVDEVVFEASPFMKNTFFSLGMSMQALELKNHSLGLAGELSFGKWLHEDHALRAQLRLGKWNDNYDNTPVLGTQFDVSYLFNVSSFVDGYRPNRFSDINLVAGIGYANSTSLGDVEKVRNSLSGHAFSFHAGSRVDLRIFKNLDLFIEPQAVFFTEDVTSYQGTWKGIKPAFRATVGLTYNVMQSYGQDSPRLLPRKEGYFLNLMGGFHFQNSRLVLKDIGLKKCMGLHVSFGVGKNYTEWFAMRYSFAFSHNPWVEYEGATLPCNYYAICPEAVIDVLSLVRYFMFDGTATRHAFLSASVVVGPEIGYMHKKDRNDALKTMYMGITGGAQVKFRLTPTFAMFAEPRFSIVPYAARVPVGTMLNSHKNYYDGLLNFNVGMELSL